MKKIKIKFVGYWEGFDPETQIIYQFLKKHYDVSIVDDDPEYIICTIGGSLYEYCDYPQVRVLDCGENYTPDFNLVDYAISRYPIEFQDRNFFMPGCVSAETVSSARFASLKEKNRNYDESIMDEKVYFASFIASHESENGIRGDFFKKLCEYKRVESPGTYLNNMPNGEIVRWENDSKPNFQRKCKFSLCFESTKHEGFVTEKITDAFFSDTIPVYYGSDDVTKIFNPKAFINCSDYNSFEEAIEKIKELDSDNQKYLEMLRQPILNNPDYYEELMSGYEAFVCNIFDQPIEKAYRRSRVYWPHVYDEWIKRQKHAVNASSSPFGTVIKEIIKRIIRKVKK